MNEIVYIEKGEAITSSLLVAEFFGKQHKHVIDSIRELIKGLAEFTADHLFEESIYIHEQNKQEYTMYIMNREGFDLLSMGFTGQKALRFKYEYMKQFRKMEQIINKELIAMSITKPKRTIKKPITTKTVLTAMAELIMKQQTRIKEVEKRLSDMDSANLLLLPITNINQETRLRDKIRQLVNSYSNKTGSKQQEVWRKLYSELYYRNHIQLSKHKREERETMLDVAERLGHLEKLYVIISKMDKGPHIKRI